jgi:hypothetical protein
MAKRKLTVTFEDGSAISRTTTNATLRYGWLVELDIPWSFDPITGAVLKGQHRQALKTGFSSTRIAADQASESCANKKEGVRIVRKEIIEAEVAR